MRRSASPIKGWAFALCAFALLCSFKGVSAAVPVRWTRVGLSVEQIAKADELERRVREARSEHAGDPGGAVPAIELVNEIGFDMRGLSVPEVAPFLLHPLEEVRRLAYYDLHHRAFQLRFRDPAEQRNVRRTVAAVLDGETGGLMREYLLSLAARIRAKEAAPAAVRLLSDDRYPHIRAGAARALAVIGDRRAASALLRATYDSDRFLPAEAVRSLAVLNVRTGLPRLRELACEEGSLQSAALDGLARFMDRRSLPCIRRQVRSPEQAVVAMAVGALGRLKDRESESRLRDLLKPADPWLARYVREALDRLDEERVIRETVLLLDSTNNRVRREAVVRLSALCDDNPSLLRTLAERLRKNPKDRSVASCLSKALERRRLAGTETVETMTRSDFEGLMNALALDEDFRTLMADDVFDVSEIEGCYFVTYGSGGGGGSLLILRDGSKWSAPVGISNWVA